MPIVGVMVCGFELKVCIMGMYYRYVSQVCIINVYGSYCSV